MISLTNHLIDKFPTDIGKIPINLAFNRVINWYDVAERDDISDPQKMRTGWSIFFGNELEFNSIDDYEVAMRALKDVTDYISQDPYEKQELIVDGQEQSNRQPTKWFSYKEDAEAIYSSFLFDYGIDLVDKQDKLRWEKFRALFNNLSHKSPIMRIIDIRMTDVSQYEGKALADLVESQNYYSLESQSVDNLNNNIGNMFNMIKNMIPKE